MYQFPSLVSVFPIFHPSILPSQPFQFPSNGKDFQNAKEWKVGRMEEWKSGRMTIGRMTSNECIRINSLQKGVPIFLSSIHPSYIRVSTSIIGEVSAQSSTLPSSPSYIRVSIPLRCEVSSQSSFLPSFHPNRFNSLQTGRTFRTEKNGRLEDWKSGRAEGLGRMSIGRMRAMNAYASIPFKREAPFLILPIFLSSIHPSLQGE